MKFYRLFFYNLKNLNRRESGKEIRMPRNTKWINQPVKWNSDEGHVSALFLTKADKWIRILPLRGKLRVQKLSIKDEWRLKPLEFKGEPYPIKRAVRHFRKHAGIFGMTTPAKQALAEAFITEREPFTLKQEGARKDPAPQSKR